ncbi:hypothetical protein FOZ63_002340, partial [Perkinsus olseni]
PRRVPLKIKVWWLKHGSVIEEDTLECWLKPCHATGSPLEVLIDRPKVPDCELALLINPELESFALCPPPSQETLPGPRQLSRVEQCALVVSLVLDIKRRRESRGEDARDLEKEWYWQALWSIAAASDGGKLSAAGAFYTAVEAECEDAALEVLRLQDDIRRLESGEIFPEVYDAAALKTAESKRRELVERSLKSHGVEEYTEQALDLLCALLSHEVQEHMTARRTLPTNALTIPSGGIVDAMTASSLALDITLPRSENRYNDAFSSVKRRRGVSGDVFEAVTRGADGDEFVTADAPMDGGSVENSSDYDASS